MITKASDNCISLAKQGFKVLWVQESISVSQSKLCFELTTPRKLKKTSAWWQVLHLSPKSFLCLQSHCSSTQGTGWVLASFSSACFLLHRSCHRLHVWKHRKGGVRLDHRCALHSQNQFWTSGVQHTFPTTTRNALEQSYPNGDKFSEGDFWTNHVTVTSNTAIPLVGTEEQCGITSTNLSVSWQSPGCLLFNS